MVRVRVKIPGTVVSLHLESDPLSTLLPKQITFDPDLKCPLERVRDRRSVIWILFRQPPHHPVFSLLLGFLSARWSEQGCSHRTRNSDSFRELLVVSDKRTIGSETETPFKRVVTRSDRCWLYLSVPSWKNLSSSLSLRPPCATNKVRTRTRPEFDSVGEKLMNCVDYQV